MIAVPPGALDQDAEMSAAPVAEEEWPPGLEEEDLVGSVYDLKPDGLTFNKPVEVTITLDRDDLETPNDGAPIGQFFTQSGTDAIEALRDSRVTIDSRSVTYTATATHFSRVFLGEAAVISMRPSEVKHSTDGPPWMPEITVTNVLRRSTALRRFYFDGPLSVEDIRYIREDAVVLAGGTTHPNFEIGEREARVLDSPGPAFSCVEEGTGGYGVRLRIVPKVSFTFPVPIGTTILGDAECTHREGAATTETASVSTGVDVQLVAVGSAAEVYFDPPLRGLPVPGARVVVVDSDGEEIKGVTTDSEGQVQIDLAPGEYTVRWDPVGQFEYVGPECESAQVEVKAGEVTSVRLVAFDNSDGPNQFGTPEQPGLGIGCPQEPPG